MRYSQAHIKYMEDMRSENEKLVFPDKPARERRRLNLRPDWHGEKKENVMKSEEKK